MFATISEYFPVQLTYLLHPPFPLLSLRTSVRSLAGPTVDKNCVCVCVESVGYGTLKNLYSVQGAITLQFHRVVSFSLSFSLLASIKLTPFIFVTQNTKLHQNVASYYGRYTYFRMKLTEMVSQKCSHQMRYCTL